MIGTYITLNKNVLEVYINADTDTLSIMIGDIGTMTQDLWFKRNLNKILQKEN